MSTDPPSPAPAVWSEVAGPADAPVVVLVHGSMDRAAGMLRLSRRLDGEHRVARFDRRGYGRSVAVGPPFTVAANVDDLASVVDRHAGGRPVTLFGHSFGGNVALAYAQREPASVAAVVVYETPMSWFDWWPGNSAGGAAMAAPDSGAAAEAFIRRLVGDETWDSLSPTKQDQRRREGAAMVGELADLRARAPWDPERITVPVLAMCGEHGRPHHRDGMRMISSLLPDARTIEVAGAGHAGPNTHAAAVADPVAAFIAERSSAGSRGGT